MEAHSLIEDDGGDLSEMYADWQRRLDPSFYRKDEALEPRDETHEPGDETVHARSSGPSSISTFRKSDVDAETKLIQRKRILHGFRNMALGPFFLIGYAVIFLILAVVLGSLYAWSGRNHGLATTDENWHYIFKYGPTAVLTIVAAFWYKIEYRTKQIAPWKKMSEGFAPAKATLLLDYITPINIVTLPLAVQARQFAVALGISGTFLIQILIVISTGLLALENQLIEHKHAKLQTIEKFDASSFNSSRVDNRPYLSVYGIAHLNTSFPAGTTAQYSFQPFNTSHISVSANSTMKATVDVLSPDLECRNGNGSLYYVPHSSGGSVTASTPDCKIQLEVDQLSSAGYLGYMKPVVCVNQTGEDAQRLLICTAHMRYVPPETLPDGNAIWTQHATDNTTCLICRPTYRRTLGNVTISGDTNVPSTVTVSEDALNTPIPFLSPWELGSAAVHSMDGTSAALNASTIISDDTGFFQLVNYTSPLLKPWDLLDEEYLRDSSRKAFQLLVGQVAKAHLMIPENKTVEGSYSAIESRLCFQAASFYAMEFLFVVLILIAISLSLLNRKPFVSRDVGSLIGISTVLAQSHDAMKSVRGTGHASLMRLKNHLSDCAYATSTSSNSNPPTFRIAVASGSATRRNSSSFNAVTTMKMRWWRPFALTFWGRLLTCLAPVAYIVTLQALLHKSQTSDGIVTVPKVPYIHFAWTLLPAAISLGIATLFYTFQIALRLIQPYQTLKKGSVPARTSLFDDYNTEIALQTFWHATRRRHVALLASTIAVICAPFLTIVVSGLYKTDHVSSTYPVQINVTGWFNSTVDSSLRDVTAGIVQSANEDVLSSLIIYSNATFPNWTTPELATAQFDTTNKSFVTELLRTQITTDTMSTISGILPAIWPIINCIAQPFESAEWRANRSIEFSNYIGPWLNVSIKVPEECNGAMETTDLNSTVSNGTWHAGLPFGNRVSSGWKTFPSWRLPSTNCPTAMAVFGIASNKDRMEEDLTVITCKPYMWNVAANITFAMPGFDLSAHLWPSFNYSTGSLFNNESAWTLLRNSDEPDLVFNPALVPVNMSDSDPRIGQLDGFFQVLLQSPEATWFDDFNTTTDVLSTYLGVANNATLLDSMQYLYSLTMSQIMNSRKRIQVGTGWSHTSASGNITSLDHERLYQDATSTYVLTGLLSVMFICAVIATLITDTKQLLPKNPCSIAATASLLSDSEILALIPPGSEWCDDRELKSKGLFEGYLFSMGWWGIAESSKRKFGIDVGKAEKVG